MVGIVFYFEPNDVDVYSGRRIDLDAWCYAAKAAGDVDEMIVVNRSGVELRLNDFEVVDEMPRLDGRVAHVCCPWERHRADVSIPLWSFDHLVDWYSFGPATGWKNTSEIMKLGVYIPTASTVALHSAHAATVVLSHRYSKVEG